MTVYQLKKVNRIQLLIGIAGLLSGTIFYLAFRCPDQTYFISKFGVDICLRSIFQRRLGTIGNNLPTFIHVFSFILLTAAFIHLNKRKCFLICLCWCVVDCAFELGQKFNSLSSMIPDWFAGIPILENTGNYFLHGTYDLNDLIAIIIGTVFAFFTLQMTADRGNQK